MQAKFRVQSTFLFNTYSYVMVFNTNGNPNAPVTPLASGTYNGYKGYSFAISVTAIGGALNTTAYIFQAPSTNPTGAPFVFPILTAPQQLQSTYNSNGLGTEFSILFETLLAQSLAQTTPTPTPTATPTGGATPTPTPTPTPGLTPSPTPSPVAPAIGNTWFFNYFVVQGNLGGNNTLQSALIQDSLGTGGATDNSYSSQALNIATSFDYTITANIPSPAPADPAAYITGGELLNTPLS
jgi:hypothetical protein